MKMMRLDRTGDPMVSTPDAIMVRLGGGLSVIDGQRILGVILAEVGDEPRDVIVDLSRADDMSSWGSALVCGLARRLARCGHMLRVVAAALSVRRYLEMFASPVEPVEFHDTRAEALREARQTSWSPSPCAAGATGVVLEAVGAL